MKMRVPKRGGFRPAVLAIAGLASQAASIDLPPGFTDAVLARGLNPTCMAFAPDGRLFLNEKDGKIRILKGDALLERPFAVVDADPYNERGLLGIAFDPAFASTRHVFVLYTTKAAPTRTRISRFTADGDVAAGGETVIFEVDGVSPNGNHNGGTIAFGADGKLYASIGNNAIGSTSQSTASLFGKLLRLDKDGSIPADNPFSASAEGRARAIWALGFRNPYTFAVEPGSGRILVNDVGGNGFEEVSEAVEGANYGFPAVEGNSGNPPSGPGPYKAPLAVYPHAGTDCAITGGTFFDPPVSTFPPEFRGRYLIADYCGGWIKSLDPDKGGGLAAFATGVAAPVNIQAGPDGRLYVLTRGSSKGGSAAATQTRIGELHRIAGPRTPTSVPKGNPVGFRTDARALVGPGSAFPWPPGASIARLYDWEGRLAATVKRSESPGPGRVPPMADGVYRIRFLR